MFLKSLLSQFNFAKECKKCNLPLWQCPSFLFVIMGLVIIVAILSIYFIGVRYGNDPQIVAIITILVTAILFIISYIITSSFERLAQASRMKSEFVSIVSHQLRTPLSSMNWVIELFLDKRLGDFDQKQIENFSIIQENIRRMNNLVNDLLNVARIEQGRLEMLPKNFSLKELVEKVASSLQIFAKANNISLALSMPEDLSVFADPERIRLVFENILDNAIRYTKQGSEVKIAVNKKSSKAKIVISDEGVGIPAEEQKYIFQKFFRSKNILRHQTEGTGLGLYIAKAIIEQSGGAIGFESKEGDGSTFWFTLPLEK